MRFWKYGEVYYRLVDGSPSGELDNYKYAQVPLVDLYGHSPACKFGPLNLKAVRQKMIDSRRYLVRFSDNKITPERWMREGHLRQRDGQPGQWEALQKKKWLPVEVLRQKSAICRKEINRRVVLIRRIFKWAASEELEQHESLQRRKDHASGTLKKQKPLLTDLERRYRA